MGVALFYESSRTPLVTTIFAAGLVLAAVRARNPVVVLGFGIAAVALLPFVIGHVTSGSSDPYSGGLVGHQLSGLAHPFSSEDSTLSGHFGLMTHGFNIMLHHPLGTGASVVNIAGAKLGGVASNTEYDPSNVAIALGVPGLLAYLVIVVEAFRLALGRVRERKDALSRAALGIIAVTVLEWTNGGLYAVAFLPWLMMGWLDRDTRTSEPPSPSAEAEIDAAPDSSRATNYNPPADRALRCVLRGSAPSATAAAPAWGESCSTRLLISGTRSTSTSMASTCGRNRQSSTYWTVTPRSRQSRSRTLGGGTGGTAATECSPSPPVSWCARGSIASSAGGCWPSSRSGTTTASFSFRKLSSSRWAAIATSCRLSSSTLQPRRR